jgi:hypothetical protein
MVCEADILIPWVDTVYSEISLKIMLFICNEFH